MYKGTGVPAFAYNGNIIELPRPKAGGRDNNYSQIGESYESIDGQLIPPDPREWRYIAKFEFSKLSNDVINQIIEIYNKSATIKFIPHIDVPQIAYKVILEKVQPSDEVYKDGLVVEMKSQNVVRKIPTIDNMISCFQYNRVIVFNGG